MLGIGVKIVGVQNELFRIIGEVFFKFNGSMPIYFSSTLCESALQFILSVIFPPVIRVLKFLQFIDNYLCQLGYYFYVFRV